MPHSTQVYELLRQRIITLQLKPRQRIDIGTAAKELAVSTTPVREALKQLTERGLVQARPNLGYHVVDLSDEDIRDIFALRLLLETFALERGITRFPKTQLIDVRSETQGLLNQALPFAQLRQQFERNDERLHKELIIRNSGNRFIITLYDVMADFVSVVKQLTGAWFNTQERMDAAIREHLSLIDALEARDLQAAETILKEHIRSAEQGCFSVLLTDRARRGAEGGDRRREQSMRERA